MKEHKRNVLSAGCTSLSFFCLRSLDMCQRLPVFPCFLTPDLYFWCSPRSLQSSLCCLVRSVLSCLITLQLPSCKPWLLSSPSVFSGASFFIVCSFPSLVLSLLGSCTYSSVILSGSIPQQDVWGWRAGSSKL